MSTKKIHRKRTQRKQVSDTFFDKETGRTLHKRPDARILSPVFDDDYFFDLKKYLNNIETERINFKYDGGFGRSTHHSTNADPNGIFYQSHQKLVPIARKIFGNENIEASYCIYSVYRGYRANLFRHIDDNACTYTIDMCVSYKDPWSIFVEDVELCPKQNEAVIYYGEDQYHWRPKFPNPKENHVAMIFYHFVDKNHWFFTHGPEHVAEVISKREVYQRSITS